MKPNYDRLSDATVLAAVRGADLVGVQQVCYDELLRRLAGKECSECNVRVAVAAVKQGLVERLHSLCGEIARVEKALLAIQPPE